MPATRSFGQQGFSCAFRDVGDGIILQLWTEPNQNLPAQYVRLRSSTAACVGPLFYRGRFGKAALKLLLAETHDTSEDAGLEADSQMLDPQSPTAPPIDETELRGNFALFLRAGTRCWLLNDSLGLVRIYSSSDSRYYSTSWLATRAYTGCSDIDASAAIEYVLLGAPHSDRTVAQSVNKLALGTGLDLRTRRIYQRFAPVIVPASMGRSRFTSLHQAVDVIGELLRNRFRDIVAAFPDRTSVAISGGFDSRLILATLLAEGECPRLFVYGGPESEDVRIARQIAQTAGIPLNVVDKGTLSARAPQPVLDTLIRSALFFDGLPNDGIYDSGADRNTRVEHSANGLIALNGGGGEIFRNFFHLPNRRYRPVDVLRSFYRAFDARVFKRPNGLATYERTLSLSIAGSIGLSMLDDPTSLHVPREQIELIYPLFRCHHWMGLNNSVSIRYGYFATPLIDLDLVRLTFDLPLSWKHAGLLESRLIARLHPGVASENSTYGFRFIDGPGVMARCNESLTNMRPVSLRPMIGALRRKLRKDRVSAKMIDLCRSMLPGEWRLDPLLNLDQLPANGAFERALSIEVVSRELPP